MPNPDPQPLNPEPAARLVRTKPRALLFWLAGHSCRTKRKWRQDPFGKSGEVSGGDRSRYRSRCRRVEGKRDDPTSDPLPNCPGQLGTGPGCKVQCVTLQCCPCFSLCVMSRVLAFAFFGRSCSFL